MDLINERVACENGFDVECNVIETKVVYDIGGISWATSQPKKRGYYIHCSPLDVGGGFVRYQGFSGTCMLLNEVKRQSKKAEQEALKLYAENKQKLIDYVCNKHGIKLRG